MMKVIFSFSLFLASFAHYAADQANQAITECNEYEECVLKNNSSIRSVTYVTKHFKTPVSTLLKSVAIILGLGAMCQGQDVMEKACGALLSGLAACSLTSNIIHEQQEKSIEKAWHKKFERARGIASNILILGTLVAMISTVLEHGTDFYNSLPSIKRNIQNGDLVALASFAGLYYLLYKGVFAGIPAVGESIQEDLFSQTSTERRLDSIAVYRTPDSSFCAVDFRSPTFQVSLDQEMKEVIVDTVCG